LKVVGTSRNNAEASSHVTVVRIKDTQWNARKWCFIQ